MYRIIRSRRFDLVEPIGIGTGLVEASSSVWKRTAERLSVRFGDFVRWAFDQQAMATNSQSAESGQLALNRRMLGIDGLTTVGERYLEPLRGLVASDHIEACTLLPFSGLLCGKLLLRRRRAWCPICLSSMEEKNQVYEPLLWRLRDVTMCPIHSVDLVEVCPVCNGPVQEVISRCARVGCCGLCGNWMGTKGSVLVHRDDQEPGARMSRVVLSLLAHTAEFKNPGHDGRLTLRRMVKSREIRDLLASTLGVSSRVMANHAYQLILPRLAVLATVASVSRQPLHRVILGELISWRDRSEAEMKTLKGRPRYVWETIRTEFEVIANSDDVVNLEDACRQVGVSIDSARIHFPDLVCRIVKKGEVRRRGNYAAKKQARVDQVRHAFRVLVADGIYPSIPRLQSITCIDVGKLLRDRKDLFDEDWAWAEGMNIRRRGYTRRVAVG